MMPFFLSFYSLLYFVWLTRSMIIKTITVHREMTLPGKVPFSSKKFGGSVEISVELGEDWREVFHKGWQIIGSQVLKQMNDRGGTDETQKEQEQIDLELGF